MQYCLDTNVYIESHRRYYAFDIAPGFWDGLKRLAEEQIICSPSLVYTEIMDADYDDELTKWAQAIHDQLFVEADDPTQDAYRDIADLVASLYEPQHIQEFLSGADPWVISHAKAHQLSVVTMESWKNENKTKTGRLSGKIQIPNVCKRVGVAYQDTFALLREQKVILR